MKKTTLILALIFGVLLFNSSKPIEKNPPKTRLDSLMSKKWVLKRGNYSEIETYSKNNKVSKQNRSDGRSLTLGYTYYLTDDISKLGPTSKDKLTNFDWSKVGESLNGKYLVTLVTKLDNKKYKSSYCPIYEIIELTDSKLHLQIVYQTGEWAALPESIYYAEPLD